MNFYLQMMTKNKTESSSQKIVNMKRTKLTTGAGLQQSHSFASPLQLPSANDYAFLKEYSTINRS